MDPTGQTRIVRGLSGAGPKYDITMDRLKKLVCYPRGPRASRASPWTWVRLSTPICWVERAISNDVSYMSVVLFYVVQCLFRFGPEYCNRAQ